MEHRLHVSDLGLPTLTRTRGREAYGNWREYWQEGSATILLDGVTMLSLSFLDGLVLELLAAGELERVTFETREPRTRHKLARVAGLHPEAVLYVKGAPADDRQRVTPAVVEAEEVVAEPTKDMGLDSLEPTTMLRSGYYARGRER